MDRAHGHSLTVEISSRAHGLHAWSFCRSDLGRLVSLVRARAPCRKYHVLAPQSRLRLPAPRGVGALIACPESLSAVTARDSEFLFA